MAAVTVNKNSVYGDTSALTPGGVRLGTPALTSRGLKEQDFVKVADFLVCAPPPLFFLERAAPPHPPHLPVHFTPPSFAHRRVDWASLLSSCRDAVIAPICRVSTRLAPFEMPSPSVSHRAQSAISDELPYVRRSYEVEIPNSRSDATSLIKALMEHDQFTVDLNNLHGVRGRAN